MVRPELIFQTILLLGVVGTVVYTTMALSNATANADSRKEFASTLRIIGIVNAILIILLAVASYMYIRAEPLNERPYLIIMLHVNLFFSMLAVSIASLQKLS